MSEIGLSGYRTTFSAMFSAQVDGTPQVNEVEIPLIQRDYAQGREDPRTSAIRERFLDALHLALTTDEPIGLDFVYGEVRDATFEPLDGQQRLTTLFLLHWYLASRCGQFDGTQPWHRFTYATRPSARRFCERIAQHPLPPQLVGAPSAWITDQSWYLHLWRYDPTIASMLVMLDAISQRFAREDASLLWGRLTREDRPAIWFQLLPIDDMGAAEDLYIKMNSRGKPLTPFEAFKAHLGQLVAEMGEHDDFGHRIDGAWTDLLWPYRGENDIVDDEFMRYLDFLMEICEWSEGRGGNDGTVTAELRISDLLASTNPHREEHLKFICAAFDVLIDGPPPPKLFAGLFTTSLASSGVRLFGSPSTDLFDTCCERYGEARGTNRVFSLTDTLLFYAVLVHLMDGTEDVEARLRTLRNVNEASQFEMRVQNMPKFVAEVAAYMRTGNLDALATFNKNQVADEARKRAFLHDHPQLASAIERLEDHTILRGTLSAFDLDDDIEARAQAFEEVFAPDLWPALTGALLAVGEYQRDLPNSDQHRFGSPTTESVWRQLLVDRGDYESLARVRSVLGELLDRVAASPEAPATTLDSLASEFIDARIASERLDWRYYLVRYPMMREGNSGIYYGADGGLGYELTMLRKQMQSSWYRDAYLYAIWCEAGRPSEVEDPWFHGYSTKPRWMRLKRSQAGLRSVAEGIAIEPPATPDAKDVDAACQAAGAIRTKAGWLLSVPQASHDGVLLDTEDRVQLANALLRSLIAAEL